MTFLRSGSVAVLLVTTPVSAAHAQNCRAISDSLERLRCYDGVSGPPSLAPAATPSDNPVISQAKSAVLKILRDPESARFQDLQIKTKSGQTAVCGQVNSRNSMGGMTGPKL